MIFSPATYRFMFGVAIAILVNYPGAKMQKKIINSHAGPALMMCSTLMGAAVLMGILVKSVTVGDVEVASVITCMSDLISAASFPAFLGQSSAIGYRYPQCTVGTGIRY